MTSPRDSCASRSGAAAVWAVVVLAVMSGLSVAAIGRFASVRKQEEAFRCRLQAEWLARSGYELALAKLMGDAGGYTGETVDPIPDGKVKITVKEDAAAKGVYRIECEARYSTGSHPVVHRLRRAVKRIDDPKGARFESVLDPPSAKP